ncbi:hypothetical protein X749_14680 [Mesorhizobium sp. LNJC391B00]|nr:hypothetical protein X749_14680 [Mesorhizobium sp. LNJC391B00]
MFAARTVMGEILKRMYGGMMDACKHLDKIIAKLK